MERLTKEFYYTNEPTTWTQKVNNKLGELEDLMEQEGCKSVQDLKLKLELLKQMQIAAAKTFAENKELKEKAKESCRYFNQEIEDKSNHIVMLEKALDLACEELPCHCPAPPVERYNAQSEYGSDTPVWIEEGGGCEFSEPYRCLECTIEHFILKAKEKIKKYGDKNNDN